MKRILIIKLSALGDIVQAEGAIRDIRNHHSDDHIIIMTTPAFKDIMERCPWIDEVFIDPRRPRWRLDKMYSLKKRLAKLEVSVVYDLQQVSRTKFYSYFFKQSIPWIGQIKGKLRKQQNTKKLCMADRFTQQFKFYGLTTKHCKKPDLQWMASDMSILLTKHKITCPYIVLIPGASSGHDDKRWPYFDQLASWLTKKGEKVVTVPGPGELDLCNSINDATMLTDNGRYLDLFELAGVLKQAKFIIGNDTGPTHMGAYLNIPGIALFGNHLSAHMTGIQNSLFSWIEKDNLANLSLKEMQDILNTSPVLNIS